MIVIFSHVVNFSDEDDATSCMLWSWSIECAQLTHEKCCSLL